jgi:hypothetical protein
MLQERPANARAPRVWADGEIQYFHVTRHLARDEKSDDFGGFLSYPSGHFALRDAFVIPHGPLCDFGTYGLNREDCFHIAGLEGANLQRL